MDVRSQYECFPYPPLPRFALPVKGQGESLRFESGAAFAGTSAASHEGKRILVAGCGTLEPLVVARTHPRAAEIVALDLSERSLSILHDRLRIDRLARPLRKRPPVTLVRADVERFDLARLGSFDYVLASNVLHHLSDPRRTLQRLAALLVPGGLLRMVTYPKASRIWMRETSRYLKSKGLTPYSPRLRSEAERLIGLLPQESPIRSCYLSQRETLTTTGIVDAFLHARENPLRPLEWKSACDLAGLTLVGESQDPSSRSEFLGEIFPPLRRLGRWESLQVLDDLLELCANPVLWLRKSGERIEPDTTCDFVTGAPESATEDPGVEMRAGLERVRAIARLSPSELAALLEAFRTRVGPRTSPQGHELPGLSIGEHPAYYS